MTWAAENIDRLVRQVLELELRLTRVERFLDNKFDVIPSLEFTPPTTDDEQ